MHYVELTHDAFARWTLLRCKLDRPLTCAWCGNPKARFRYAVQDDSQGGFHAPDFCRGAYCGVSCFRMDRGIE